MKRSEIPLLKLAPIGSLFFGSFKLLDKHVNTSPVKDDSKLALTSSEASYVDYGFGSDRYSFAGCHRFSIGSIYQEHCHKAGHTQTVSDNKEPRVEIRLQSFTCNPKSKKMSNISILSWFHRLYAKLLFADGMRKIFHG